MSRLIQVFQVICILTYCCFCTSLNTRSTWNYEVISIQSNSTDENMIKFDLKTNRIRRGVYGISGTILVNADIEVGDDTMIEALVYRSATGSSEYQLTPFTMQKQHVYQFMDSFYKDILMKSLATCSDLPNFKDKFQPPLEKKTYTLKDCQVNQDGLPPYMTEGFYRLDVTGSGRVNFFWQGIFKVEHE